MTSSQSSAIIRERVTDLRSALFFNIGEAPTVYSVGIISALDVDDEGDIYFFITRPEVLLMEDRRFPARLEFYRKGKPYFLKVNGAAELVTDPVIVDRYFKAYKMQLTSPTKNLALAKVKVQQVEYNEPQEITNTHLFSKVVAWFSWSKPFTFS